MEDNPKKISITCSLNIHAAHKLYRDDWSQQKNRDVLGHCCDLHGHQYRLEVTIKGGIDPETGMLMNGYALENLVKQNILTQLDHKFLNDHPFFKDRLTTVEWISVWVFDEIKKKLPSPCVLQKVKLWETPDLYAEYEN